MVYALFVGSSDVTTPYVCRVNSKMTENKFNELVAIIPAHIRMTAMQIHQHILQSAACECPCASVCVRMRVHVCTCRNVVKSRALLMIIYSSLALTP